MLGQSAGDQLVKGLHAPDVRKAVSATTLNSLERQLGQAGLVKDLDLGTGSVSHRLGGGTDLVAFDLEQPALQLSPRPTPLRNRMPRKRGQGTAHQFQRITGHTGSGTGGMILGSRCTDSGASGALSAPTSVAATTASTGASETAISGYTTNVYVKVTAESVMGESALSSAASAAPSAGEVVKLTWDHITGATGYQIYLSTGASDPGDASRWFQLRVPSNSVTLQGAIVTSGTDKADGVTNRPSATARNYDGMLAYLLDPAQAGYFKRVDSTLSTSNPGDEFSVAFAELYESVKANPDQILANGYDRKQISDLLKTSSSSSYRITVDNAGEVHDAGIGALVTAIQNEVTGNMVDLIVHPWIPQGNLPILTWSLPIPDSNVESCWSMVGPSDVLMLQWPVTQLAYEASTWWMNTLVAYAPMFSGCLTDVLKA